MEKKDSRTQPQKINKKALLLLLSLFASSS